MLSRANCWKFCTTTPRRDDRGDRNLAYVLLHPISGGDHQRSKEATASFSQHDHEATPVLCAMSPSRKQQKPLTAFFGLGSTTTTTGNNSKHNKVGGGEDAARRPPTAKRQRRNHHHGRSSSSHFGACPLCQNVFPVHQLERHASDCDGEPTIDDATTTTEPANVVLKSEPCAALVDVPRTENEEPAVLVVHSQSEVVASSQNPQQKIHTSEPIPGLYLYENFITEEEELQILAELDGKAAEFANEYLPWKPANFNGPHSVKRWGVHCNLRDRKVGEAEHPLPNFVQQCIAPRLLRLGPMKGCTPNEANAIDYHKQQGHYLKSHVDDRQLSKEPIANLSLAGDCYMTFRNVAPHRNAVVPKKVLLKRRCLQILTGKARYDFSHGIESADLLSDRRVSVTMRESPLTIRRHSGTRTSEQMVSQLWWKTGKPVVKSIPVSPVKCWIPPAREPIPGLYIFPDFITQEEEALILQEIDDHSIQSWTLERHTGRNRQKLWGVDHDLWSQVVRPPKYELPAFVHTLLIPRLQRLKCMQGCTPNEVNALEYCRALGHSLSAHVDDRKKHKEPIANLSLAGDCYMTFRNVQTHRNLAVRQERIWLPRRCLQVMTGKARYDFTHGIATEDLLSDRRVSVTLRETPLR